MILIPKIHVRYGFKLTFKKRPSTDGFTLAELLVASVLTLGVITTCGIVFNQILKEDIKSELKSQIPSELDRTFELIEREISFSKVSAQPRTDATTNPKIINYGNIPSDATYILVLTQDDLAAPIVYFTLPRSSNSITQPWLLSQGSNLVLYRWGPRLDESGVQYDSMDDPSAWGAPTPMIDHLSATPITVSCPNTWKLIPNSGTTEGINGCVKPTTAIATTGQQVRLKLASQVKSPRLTQNKNQPNEDEIIYKIEAEIYSKVK
ncbi:hypothetical protein PCC7424_4999 [Gloeothece citriformis PCC 7424]|uniref:Type II secretion system protein n=1 Tax=Gloeothece citriformis (strain PCC 7424) TaxID=65393 RepID=B7KFM7_GLOC7|nr:hypothetical protein [Gloeothece citriformis]ACK73352.1 hypothetical protein PCC7424_4999 [Gloeothece citriformis PCC 7424]